MFSWYQIVTILGGLTILAIAGIVQSRREQKAIIKEIEQKQRLARQLNALGNGAIFTTAQPMFQDVRPGDRIWLGGSGPDAGYYTVTGVPSHSILNFAPDTWWRRAYWAVRRFLSRLWYRLWREPHG